MFDNLSDRLEAIYKKLKGRGKLKEADVDEALKEIRVALLEADVSLSVAKEFLADIREKAIGREVLSSLTPGHQMVKIVNDELTELLGGSVSNLEFSANPPTILLMAGLQGSGKTTSSGKLAKKLKKEGKKCLLVPADVYRPAATEQLKILGNDIEVDVFSPEGSKDPVEICEKAVLQAKKSMAHVVILDTAGRMQIDNDLMDELRRIKDKVNPHETLFVADSMMGQEAVNIAKSFHDAIGVDGIVLTKMDGDARGGAALSIKKVTGKPIKFIGTGEKLDALDPFHPERVISRILGMGDVLTLIDKAEEAYDQEEKSKLEDKLNKNRFTLEDFQDQLQQIKKMGSIRQLMGMIPGAQKLKSVDVDDNALVKVEAIINSMTKKERGSHKIINSSRKRRIATGSGTTVNDVNKLLKQFIQMQKMMKKFSSGKMKGGMNMNNLMGGRGLSPF
jgi:signal recognition particle subunit SRP54